MRRAAAAAALALGLVGCGGDDDEEQPAADGGQRSQTTARTATGPSPDAAPTTQAEPGGRTKTTGPEDQPGGAGDEEPARSQALLTGRGGRISPRLVRVPPFISVRVELRSADGREYGLRMAGRRLSVGGGSRSASTTLDGLRPGAAYLGRGSDASRLRIEASAEPGP